MRTAEEVLDKNLGPNFLAPNTKESVIDAINEARKEAIETCAEQINPDGNPESAINRIYSLINELK